MADPFSIASAAIGVSSAGVKLTTTLYTYVEAARSTDDCLKAIAADVSVTSAVLHELATVLQNDQSRRLVSGGALKTANEALLGCQAAFAEVERAIAADLAKVGSGRKALAFSARIAWPLKHPKVKTLQADLERLKLTLLLMLQVLLYARSIESKSPASDAQAHRAQIQALADRAKDANIRYEDTQSIASSTAQSVTSAASISSSATLNAPLTAQVLAVDIFSAKQPHLSSRSLDQAPANMELSEDQLTVVAALDQCSSAVSTLSGALQDALGTAKQAPDNMTAKLPPVFSAHRLSGNAISFLRATVHGAEQKNRSPEITGPAVVYSSDDGGGGGHEESEHEESEDEEDKLNQAEAEENAVEIGDVPVQMHPAVPMDVGHMNMSVYALDPYADQEFEEEEYAFTQEEMARMMEKEFQRLGYGGGEYVMSSYVPATSSMVPYVVGKDALEEEALEEDALEEDALEEDAPEEDAPEEDALQVDVLQEDAVEGAQDEGRGKEEASHLDAGERFGRQGYIPATLESTKANPNERQVKANSDGGSQTIYIEDDSAQFSVPDSWALYKPRRRPSESESRLSDRPLGSDDDAKPSDTPLHGAVKNHESLVEKLLDAHESGFGHDKTLKDSSGQSVPLPYTGTNDLSEHDVATRRARDNEENKERLRTWLTGAGRKASEAQVFTVGRRASEADEELNRRPSISPSAAKKRGYKHTSSVNAFSALAGLDDEVHEEAKEGKERPRTYLGTEGNEREALAQLETVRDGSRRILEARRARRAERALDRRTIQAEYAAEADEELKRPKRQAEKLEDARMGEAEENRAVLDAEWKEFVASRKMQLSGHPVTLYSSTSAGSGGPVKRQAVAKRRTDEDRSPGTLVHFNQVSESEGQTNVVDHLVKLWTTLET